MTIDLNELILTDYADEEFDELINRINAERQRRKNEKRQKLYNNFIEVVSELRKTFPNDEAWVSVYDEDVGEIDVDLIDVIINNFDKFYKLKNKCT